MASFNPQSLTDILARFHAGERGVRLGTDDPEVPAELSLSINALLDQAQDSRRREEDLRFLRAVGHELRSPLGSIVGFSDLLLHDLDFANQAVGLDTQDYLERIQRAGKLLARLHDTVLLLLKIHTGSVRPPRQELVLGELIDEALSNVKARGVSSRVPLHLKVDAELVLMTAGPWLLRCLESYFSNAIENTTEGTIRIVATRQAGAARVVVSDTGSGLSEIDLKRIFEPFSRTRDQPDVEALHLGLGLYATKLITERILAGRVSASSRRGEGSEFVLEIPLN